MLTKIFIFFKLVAYILFILVTDVKGIINLNRTSIYALVFEHQNSEMRRRFAFLCQSISCKLIGKQLYSNSLRATALYLQISNKKIKKSWNHWHIPISGGKLIPKLLCLLPISLIAEPFSWIGVYTFLEYDDSCLIDVGTSSVSVNFFG